MGGRTSRPGIGDIAIAVAAGASMLGGTSIVSAPGERPDVVGWALLVATAALLVARRLRPSAAVWGTIVLAFLYDALDNPGAFYTVAIGIALYTAAALGRRLTAIGGAVAALASFLVVDVLAQAGHLLTGPSILWFVGWMTAAILLGEVARSRREYVEAVELRALEAERTREEEARRRAGEERLRIARDLHDVLAHSISIINVQSGAALHHLDSDPDKARRALLAVREAGRQVLHELRGSLGVLRQPEGPDDGARAPAPGIADVDRLVAVTRESGLSVELERRGRLDDLPAHVGLALYRVVQESLTNVSRHAGAEHATVLLERTRGQVLVRVDDDGRGGAPFANGVGIVGMRERLAALGGRLVAHPRPEGGFRVEGRIPLEATG